jgi:hypothetical protein
MTDLPRLEAQLRLKITRLVKDATKILRTYIKSPAPAPPTPATCPPLHTRCRLCDAVAMGHQRILNLSRVHDGM